MEYSTKDSGKRDEFLSGMKRDTQIDKPLYTELYFPLFKRYGELMARGAIKYGRSNWRLACGEEELQRFKDSALRHLIQYLSGDIDEDHLAAVWYNIQGIAMVEDKLREKNIEYNLSKLKASPSWSWITHPCQIRWTDK